MIGIYGTGGIGKTTIAKAVFNSIGQRFEARCFLANVREISSREDGLVKLQEKLLRELLGNFGSFNISSVGGTNVIKLRLCFKRVLLILDDVNESRQLKELAGNNNWFGPGSRILITTRDQHLLTYHQVDSMYEVQGLDDNQAIQLFSWQAFKRDKPVESYVKLTNCIIGYAKGLPLALIVLGSDLCGRSIQEWKSALEMYERSPHKDIYEILKISYDGLDDNEKDIFLDIACFFKGNSIEYVTKILNSCRFSSSIGIARLQDKCLINIRDQCVEMHDLLQEMGKEIVRQESSKEAGKRSRLWFHEDVCHVLEENTGTNKIEAILLDFPEVLTKIHDLSSSPNLEKLNLRNCENLVEVHHSVGFLDKLLRFYVGGCCKLRILLKRLKLRSLRSFKLDFCSSLEDFPEIECEMEFLHALNLRGTGIKELPSSIENVKGLKKLYLTSCCLKKLPSSIDSLTRLEELYVAGSNLVEVHHSVGFLDKLLRFSVHG
ncbi:hypothetical protein I3842_16G069800 [Carya illinoinensis]|uniref:Uncharacterized protein n=1 Tax=Carya illinoinensis TaxID=32201 RepID=A0A922A9L5_CARIL|nr:hypothetical protein I3842_16G069800 [Carya illinoinensis]